MKTLLVYYSLDGNTEWTAQKIAEEVDTDMLQLVPKKRMPHFGPLKFLIGGKQVLFKNKPKLQDYETDVESYDLLILATPIWASCFVPSVRTFLKKYDLSEKNIAVVTCSMSGNARKCIKKLRKAAGNPKLVAVLNLVDPKKKKNIENEERILDFCGKIKNLQMQNSRDEN